MNAACQRANLRVVEEPLGDDAREVPTRDELLALFAAACELPVPDYPRLAVQRAFLGRS